MSTMDQEQYWLLKRKRCPGLATDEGLAVDRFVCCEISAGGDAAVAVEVFTSQEGAEAELRGMEMLASGGRLLRDTYERGGWFASGKFDKVSSEAVVGVLGSEIVEMLEDSDVAYVLIDPPPVDGPIVGSLRVKPAPAFAEDLRRRLWGAVSKERV